MMKPHFPSNHFTATRWLLAALTALALVFHFPARAAQPEERWLLAFDTSAAMKKRLPAVAAELKNLLASEIGGSLHTGDSVGVWTFGQQLHMGEFPLVKWPPDDATELATNLVEFVHSRSYTGVTSLAALQPTLNQVIASSERLTVIVFCDGEGEINWTPYNDGINQTFKLGQAERKKSRQPFVLVLRSQRGKYAGGTVNFPPGALNLPPFPPLPAPVQIKTVPTNPPPAPPVAINLPPATPPALIIVGTRVSTNQAELTKVADSGPVNIPAPPASPLPVAPPPEPANPPPTNHAAAPATNLSPAKTDQATQVIPPPPVQRLTNAPPPATTNLAAPADTGDTGTRVLLLAGTGAFGLAVALVVFLVARHRRPRGSLITSSMNLPPPPPRK